MAHINEQPIEKRELSADGTLDVHSVFYTIQGEGPYCGKPSIFVRLAGCNLQCPGCDTDYTSTRKRQSVAVLMARIKAMEDEEFPNAPRPLVVITGGEPFRQNILYLVRQLRRAMYHVQIETNGTLPVPEEFPHDVTLVVSPKTGKLQESILERVFALKYVVKAGEICKDGLPTRALEHTASPVVAKPQEGFAGTIYIQPMDEGNSIRNRKNLDAAKNSCMQNGHTLQVQMHKIIGVE